MAFSSENIMRAATRISSYVLTLNSDSHLETIVRRLRAFSDEVLIVDSGSMDRTHAIAKAEGCRLLLRPFDDFRAQRQFAVSQCRFEYVFFCDCDEIPSDALVAWMGQAKHSGLQHDIYRIRREWTAFGRRVHGVCPTPSPDYPARLVRRSRATYERSARVHEGYDVPLDAAVVIEAPLEHMTFETNAELRRKLRTYSRMAAADVVGRDWSLVRLAAKALFSPPAAFLHWYLLKRNVLDGWAGVKLAAYAAAFKYGKYAGALSLRLQGYARSAASDTA
jgi:glycosyltransferase involved in cell wall biosynthesis